MRPVLRPDVKTRYKTYGSYLEPLIKSFGPYCSYCESAEKLDVEHVVPKSKPQGAPLEVEWGNLLLGCARCNRDFKKAWNDGRGSYLWPDTDNTFQAFTYLPTGQVKVNTALKPSEQQTAHNLMTLVRLDDGLEPQPVLNTRRRSRFNMAEVMKKLFIAGALSLEELMAIVYSAPSWSVWMRVFEDVPAVRERLLNDDRFPGTNGSYFR